MVENIVKVDDIFVCTQKKNFIFAKKFEYERKYWICKKV